MILKERIEWVEPSEIINRYIFRVQTNLYNDLSEYDLQEFYDELPYPDEVIPQIYRVLDTNKLTIEKPEGKEDVDWEAGLVQLTYL